MSEMDGIIQGGGIVISGVLVAKLLDLGYKVWATRHQKTRLEPQPLAVEAHKREEYVRREDFDRHIAENTKEHESLYSRLNRNDRETAEIKGMLGTLIDDVRLIKNKLLKPGDK